jgi:hypothetical protein
MLTKLFNSVWGQFQRHHFTLQQFLHALNKETGTLVIILVLVGMLREPIELTINSLLFGLRRGLESLFVPQTRIVT